MCFIIPSPFFSSIYAIHQPFSHQLPPPRGTHWTLISLIKLYERYSD